MSDTRRPTRPRRTWWDRVQQVCCLSAAAVALALSADWAVGYWYYKDVAIQDPRRRVLPFYAGFYSGRVFVKMDFPRPDDELSPDDRAWLVRDRPVARFWVGGFRHYFDDPEMVASQPRGYTAMRGLGFKWVVGTYGWGTNHNVIIPDWFSITVALFLAWLTSGPFQRAHVARKRRARGLCPTCGYDLRGSPGRCPECGAERAADPPAAATVKSG